MNEIRGTGTSPFDALGLGAPQTKANDAQGELGRDEFFSLMVTQLQNQDPLQPLESDQFLAQVAQFSSVSSMQNIERSISDLATSMGSAQALQASTMVGREVVVPGNVVRHEAGSASRIGADLPASAGAVSFEIQTPAGEVVRRLDVGSQAAGLVSVQWDGKDNGGNDLAPGNYVFTAQAVNGTAGEALATLVGAKVDSVSVGRNPPGVTLNLDTAATARLDDVREIF